MASRSKKGSAFEREICRTLSQWWAGRDDVFWRSAGSGARATTRAKKGKATANSHGDIAALDDCGKPFLKVFTVECKKGYSKHSLQDLLDAPEDAKEQLWGEWIEKAIRGSEQAGSVSWMVISKRDRREPIVLMPVDTWAELGHAASLVGYNDIGPFMFMHMQFDKILQTFCIMKLSSFLEQVKPEHIEKLAGSL